MKYFIWSIIGIVTIAIIAGFFVVGSPTQERMRKFDETRVNDLQNLQWQIVSYWQSKGVLPRVLADLEDPIRGVRVPKDAETGIDYEYVILGDMKFSLCATFKTQSSGTGTINGVMTASVPAKGVYGDTTAWNWEHSATRTCFDRTIDPQLYPPVRK